MKNCPASIPIEFNRSSLRTKQDLEKTCDFFEIKNNRQLICEVILRLSKKLESSKETLLPKDKDAKTLFEIYKYYNSLKELGLQS
jgi:hypothetical protein